MRAIPVPVRERIIRLYEQGKSTQEIAEFSGFCVAAVRRVRQQFKARGTLEPQTHLCGRKTLLTPARQAPSAKAGGPPARCDAGRVGGAHGSSVWDFDRGFVAAPAGVEL